MPGEVSEYVNGIAAPSHLTCAVIALVPNLNDTGWVLIIEGLTMAGTQAAGDVLFNREAMQPFLDKAELANGSLKPFELLIETRSFVSNAPQVKIIASRVFSKFPHEYLEMVVRLVLARTSDLNRALESPKIEIPALATSSAAVNSTPSQLPARLARRILTECL
jgi:hypothetical protein